MCTLFCQLQTAPIVRRIEEAYQMMCMLAYNDKSFDPNKEEKMEF
jgi:hypothetical protein